MGRQIVEGRGGGGGQFVEGRRSGGRGSFLGRQIVEGRRGGGGQYMHYAIIPFICALYGTVNGRKSIYFLVCRIFPDRN